jgi:dipeptidase
MKTVSTCKRCAIASLLLLAYPAAADEALGNHGKIPGADCFYTVVGKTASTTGAVLMSYNNDWSQGNDLLVKVVPATATAYRYVRLYTKVGSETPEGGINENQVGFMFGVYNYIDGKVTREDPFPVKGYGTELWDTILQKSATARQALDRLAQMAASKGFNTGAQGAMAVGDPNEAWVFEILSGHQWVAARVPDNAYFVQPNMPRIRQIDLGDPNRFRASPGLEQFAIRIGRYDPASGPFDVAWAFGDRTNLNVAFNTNRLWRAVDRWSPSLHATPDMPYASRPVFVVPDRQLGTQDLMAIERDHYEGTALDQTGGYTLMSPHDQTVWPICNHTTDYAVIWELRSYLPNPVGGVMWVAPSRPCSSTFVPFYAGITEVEPLWNSNPPHDAFLLFRAVADDLDSGGNVNGQDRYGYYYPTVRSSFGLYESAITAEQPQIEAAAQDLYRTSPAAAQQYLTDYCRQRAQEADARATALDAQIP